MGAAPGSSGQRTANRRPPISRIWAVVAAVGVALGSTACSGDSAKSGTTASSASVSSSAGSSSAGSSSTGVSAGASSTPSRTGSPSGGAAATGTSGRLLTDAEARSALLRVVDLPTGWVATPVAAPSSSVPATKPAACAGLLEALRSGTHHGSANVAYQLGQTGPQLEERIVSFPGPAAPRLQALSKVLTVCPRFTSVLSGRTVSFRLAALPFPTVGDRTFAMTAITTISGQRVTAETVYVAIGHNGLSFVNTSLHGPLAAADLQSIVRKGVARLGASVTT
jgi:hypothetical protein